MKGKKYNIKQYKSRDIISVEIHTDYGIGTYMLEVTGLLKKDKKCSRYIVKRVGDNSSILYMIKLNNRNNTNNYITVPIYINNFEYGSTIKIID